MASVKIKNVKKAYGYHNVIHGVDFEVNDQEFVVLVGPSGCGKSTLLRMIAGLETITDGEIQIGDKVVNNVPPRDRDIAMVFQNYALYPHMSTYENMAFSLRLRKRSKDEIDDKVTNAAEILNLQDYLERSPRQLSGGQRQRVAMGRALVRDARVFLFDEPLSNLDAKLRVVMRTEIKALHQRLKTTSVYVTHDQIEAMTMADRIVVMNAGVVEQIGSPLELYDKPANLFVAGFLGSPSMNFIEGKYLVDGGQACVETPDGTRLKAPVTENAKNGQTVVFGLRPEHVRLADPGEGVPMTVTVVEPTGASIEVFASLANELLCAVFHQRHPFNVGQQLTFDWEVDNAHVFDKDTGKRLQD